MTEIQSSILSFIREERPDQRITADTELMEAGVLDSIALIKTIQFLESTFGVTLPDSDIDPQIFATPASIAAYVARKLGIVEPARAAESVPAE